MACPGFAGVLVSFVPFSVGHPAFNPSTEMQCGTTCYQSEPQTPTLAVMSRMSSFFPYSPFYSSPFPSHLKLLVTAIKSARLQPPPLSFFSPEPAENLKFGEEIIRLTGVEVIKEQYRGGCVDSMLHIRSINCRG